MSRLHAAVAALLIGATFAAADDAYTVQQSNARIKMRAVLASGKPVTLMSYDGALTSVSIGDDKIGISARLTGPGGSADALEVRFWRLALGANGSETIASLERFDAVAAGGTVVPAKQATRAVVHSVEILNVLPAPPSDAAPSQAEPPPAKPHP